MRKSLVLAAALVPGLSAAQGFDGVYQLGGCGAATDGRIVIAGPTLSFWESTCRLTDPVPVRDMGDATLFDVVCSGEGQTWSYQALLMRGAEGLIVLRDGHVVTYPRCD